MIPQVELVSFIFWKNWRHQKDISKLTDLYVSKNCLDLQRKLLIYSVSLMGILVMSIPFDCSLLVSLFFHLEPICEPKSGQLKTDPARSPLPVTQPQLLIQVSLCQSMNLIWAHEFDKSTRSDWFILFYHIFYCKKFAVCFDLLEKDFRLKIKADKKTLFCQKSLFFERIKKSKRANFLKKFRIRRLGVLSED